MTADALKVIVALFFSIFVTLLFNGEFSHLNGKIFPFKLAVKLPIHCKFKFSIDILQLLNISIENLNWQWIGGGVVDVSAGASSGRGGNPPLTSLLHSNTDTTSSFWFGLIGFYGLRNLELQVHSGTGRFHIWMCGWDQRWAMTGAWVQHLP